MIILKILLILIEVFLFCCIISSITVNFKDYRAYIKTFRLLNDGTYKFMYRFDDDRTVVFRRPEFANNVDYSDDVVFFGDGGIKLMEKYEFLHRKAFWTYLDPVALFWFCRLWAWFNKNSHKFENN